MVPATWMNLISLHKFNNWISSMCSRGSEIESSNNFCLSCQNYNEARQTIPDNLEGINQSILSQDKTLWTRLLLSSESFEAEDYSDLINWIHNAFSIVHPSPGILFIVNVSCLSRNWFVTPGNSVVCSTEISLLFL